MEVLMICKGGHIIKIYIMSEKILIANFQSIVLKRKYFRMSSKEERQSAIRVCTTPWGWLQAQNQLAGTSSQSGRLPATLSMSIDLAVYRISQEKRDSAMDCLNQRWLFPHVIIIHRCEERLRSHFGCQESNSATVYWVVHFMDSKEEQGTQALHHCG